MPARRNVIQTVQLEAHIPEDLYSWLKLTLFSDLEGRVPKGAFKEFFSRKIREERDWIRLDLGPYSGFPDGYFVVGPREMVNNLKLKLEQV